MTFEESFDVHHIDRNSANNLPVNLAAMHDSCHAHLHHAGKKLTQENKDKIGVANSCKKPPRTAEHRAAIADSKRRWWSAQSLEERQRITSVGLGVANSKPREHKRGYTLTPEHRAKIAAGLRSSSKRIGRPPADAS